MTRKKSKPAREAGASSAAGAPVQAELGLQLDVPERPGLEWETRCGYPKEAVAGVDEAGRGCLAGPVVAAAVVLPDVIDFEAHPWLKQVTDSKKLTAEIREQLFEPICRWARSFAIAEASPGEIDEINILYASHLAMARAVERLKVRPWRVLVDGNICPKQLLENGRPVVKGDLRCLSIACASILAKVHRDRLMVELDSRYPGYGFAAHKGYPTPVHLAALGRLGPSSIHRRSYAPVAALLTV